MSGKTVSSLDDARTEQLGPISLSMTPLQLAVDDCKSTGNACDATHLDACALPAPTLETNRDGRDGINSDPEDVTIPSEQQNEVDIYEDSAFWQPDGSATKSNETAAAPQLTHVDHVSVH
jgi:hypothetical protein